ncbi:MAG: GNAT family N-acetyltransferase, partial [Cyanobacteria bacterium P01_A01_bin.70]
APQFRPATRADISVLLAMVAVFYQESQYPFRQEEVRRSLTLLLASPTLGQVWLILGGADRVAGYAVLTFSFSLEYGGRDAIIDELYLRPEARGQGLGTAAIAHLEKICCQQGIKALHLEVERSSPAARLYRRLGFEAHDRDFMTRLLSG